MQAGLEPAWKKCVMKVLGIESSCDETAAAVVEDGTTLLSNVVASSIDLHVEFGGVVPEIAARSHIESTTPVIKQALAQAKTSWDEIDAIAVTNGPGLGGSLLIGVLTARTLAIAKNKPLFPVNHVQAHVLANFLTKTSLPDYKLPAYAPKFPCLALIVSGGHTQLVLFNDCFDYHVLGQTQDDAVGEAFDKVAKILGLEYPGGPSISRLATRGDAGMFNFPKAKLGGKYDFSFSGLKTAVLRLAQKEIGQSYDFPSHLIADKLADQQKADFAASFQRIAIETLVDKLAQAYQEYIPASVVIAGGVAANQKLRQQVSKQGFSSVIITDPKLCTDNAAMISASGFFAAEQGNIQADPYTLETNPSLAM